MARPKLRRATLALVSLLAMATPGHAGWMRAKTTHFVVYANEDAAAITRRITNLELVDGFLRKLRRVGDDGLEAQQLTVYVTKDQETLAGLYGGTGDFSVAGFYIPRVTGAVAFTPAKAGDGSRIALRPEVVLYHEYAHHFLLGNSGLAYPAWYTEGYAELIGTVAIGDQQVVVGAPASHRVAGIFADDLGIERLMAPPKVLSGEDLEAIYARGWLLTHYLMMDAARSAQLGAYLAAFNAGTPSVAAARSAFGDLRKLNTALDRYAVQRRLPSRFVARSALPTPPVTVRPLSAGEAAMIELRMASTRGVNAKTGPALLAKGTRVATRFPGDATVQGWYAEMAYDAARDDIADAAADRALAVDPNTSQALLYKARVLLRRAVAAKSGPAAFRQARTYIVRVNKLSNDNADALALYYRSYIMAREAPSRNAVAALARAQELVPQDKSVRFALLSQLIDDDDLPRAREVLLPLAYDPHAAVDNPARKLLDALDAKADRKTLLAAITTATKAGDDDS